MKKKLNIFFAIGEYFIQHFVTALTSILETNQNLDLNFFLIYDFNDVTALTNILNQIEKNYGVKVNLIFQDSSIFNKYRIANHVSKNTYLRLLLADIIPQDIDNGLFLDSDLVVTGSLEELADLIFKPADINIDNSSTSDYIYAVREIKTESDINSKRISDLGYLTDRYFNAGVMFVNLKIWREENISSKLIDLTEKSMDKLVYWDQDILNMYFVNNWGELDKTFNALHLIWKRPKVPLIIHYAGATKPWNYINIHPYASYYHKYLRKTVFKKSGYIDFSYDKIPYKVYREIKHFLNYFRQLARGKLAE